MDTYRRVKRQQARICQCVKVDEVKTKGTKGHRNAVTGGRDRREREMVRKKVISQLLTAGAYCTMTSLLGGGPLDWKQRMMIMMLVKLS